MASIQGAIIIETVQMTILEAQQKLGTFLETLGLSNVCCRQATGISQAVWHKNTELHPLAFSPGLRSCRADCLSAGLVMKVLTHSKPSLQSTHPSYVTDFSLMHIWLLGKIWEIVI